MAPEELTCLLNVLKKHQFRGAHAEIGTAAGGTLWRMMACYPEEARPTFVVVDPLRYFPNQLEIVKKNLLENKVDPSPVDFRQKTSDQAVADAVRAGERFDFIFVDGSHKICRVTEDLRWAECLNMGGIIAFHDVCSRLRGVKIAVKRFLRKHPEFVVTAHEGTLVVVKKAAEPGRALVTAWDRLFALACSPFLQIELSIRKRLRTLQSKE
ncbi:MAG: class I SAM-dependent methyltransferase [Chlamydiia bacterium]|nr:class I SAM-dependent methyltransferase [Chlamydiia bacterium]